MFIDDFVTKYEMHDSLVLNIVLERNSLILTIDFCFWMQSDYKEGETETGIVKVVFEGVTDYTGITGEVDNFSILDMTYVNNVITILICDDYNDSSFQVQFKAKSAYLEKDNNNA